MKILVCISSVPDTTTKITFTDNNSQLNTSGFQYILNPYDEIALSKGVELAENFGGTITVIHVGDVTTEPTIRKALAIGATDAIRINAEPKDAYFVAKQIAYFCSGKNYDLILTGRESIDYNGTKVAAMLAEFLNIPSVSIAKAISIEGEYAIIEREVEGGKEVLKIKLPVVIGTAEGVAEWKIPNMRGIMGARAKSLVVVEPVEINALTEIKSFELPAQRVAVNMIDAQSPEKLIEALHLSKII